MKLPIILASTLVIGMSTSAFAGDIAKSGKFQMQGGFTDVNPQTVTLDKDHSYRVVVSWGVISPNPLNIVTAACPYVSEVKNGKADDTGHCAWTDADGDKVFSDWSGQVDMKTGKGGGPATIVGGTGKFVGITGSAPFTCQALNDNPVQYACSTNWDYQLAAEASAK
jgi:hypothetical protein